MVWIILVVLILLIVNVGLPIFIKAKINTALKKIDGYSGHIDYLSIYFFRSKISLRNTAIHTVASPAQDIPILQVPVIDIHFRWKQLFRKILDLKIRIEKPRVYVLINETMPKEAKSSNELETPSLKALIENLVSFKVDLEVIEGEIRYVKNLDGQKWDVSVSHLNIEIRNFSNRSILSNLCHVRCTSQVYEGMANLNLVLRPLNPALTLGATVELKSINLVLLNDLFKTYGKVDVSTGSLELSSEVIVAENSFDGYIKILINNVDFIGKEDQGDNILQKLWERIVGGIFSILAHNKNNQLAMVIPIEGRLDNPDESVGTVIAEFVRKAFIKELTPSLKNLNLKSIWNRARSGTKSLLRGMVGYHF